MNKSALLSAKLFLLLSLLFSANAMANLELSKSIYDEVPFSNLYSNEGALIRNVNYEPVMKLVPQIEKRYGVKLKTRGEAHITVITPPEAQGWFNADKKGINFLISTEEIQQKYMLSMQKTGFEVVCLGKQEDGMGKVAYYLVVKAPELLAMREEIQLELERRALFTGKSTSFKANKFYAHITLGFIKGDVHGVSKGPETCIEPVQLF